MWSVYDNFLSTEIEFTLYVDNHKKWLDKLL